MLVFCILLLLLVSSVVVLFFFFKQKTAYEMRISDWSSDVSSSDLQTVPRRHSQQQRFAVDHAQSQVARVLRVRRFATDEAGVDQIGRASCRERVCQYV